VIGVGAAQALIKNGAEVRGRTAVVAGSGPLLLAAAALLVKAGARVALVAEQAEWRSLLGFGGALLRSPGKILEALRYRLAFAASRYRAGTWIAQVRGDGSVSQVVVSDGRRSRDLRCDLLCVGYGLVPNLELPRLLGCVVQPDRAAVDERQETSVAGVFAAGEICGVAGAEAASAEGEIAGLAAAGVLHPGEPGVQRLLLARARARRFGEALATAFRLRSEVLDLASPETIVCRCEDVSLSLLASAASMREAKLHTRLGMGPCQGRVCGGALQALRGFAPDSVRPPLVPVPLEALASLEEKE
jgi:NADPH-dependent 2,4-dienoyl-CoA reductase/sulfur reductase-like enzyme